MNLNSFDKQCLDLAISEAQESFDKGNYSVGAVLAIGDKVLATGNNSGETSGNYSNHAETSIVIAYGEKLLAAAKAQQPITLYSTLEPCLMCLGVAVMNKINRIIYIQPDPLAGACSLDRQSLSVRYHEVWPDIIKTNYSQQPLTLIKQFLHRQIRDNIRVEWSRRFLDLLL